MSLLTRPIAGLGEKCSFWQEVSLGFCPEPSLGGVPQTPPTPPGTPAPSLLSPLPGNHLGFHFAPNFSFHLQGPLPGSHQRCHCGSRPSLGPPPRSDGAQSTWETTFLEIDPGEGALTGST